MSTDTYLTTADLATRWSMSANTIRNWRFRGLGPRFFKPAGDRGKALYKLADVLAWEAARTTGGDDPYPHTTKEI